MVFINAFVVDSEHKQVVKHIVVAAAVALHILVLVHIPNIVAAAALDILAGMPEAVDRPEVAVVGTLAAVVFAAACKLLLPVVVNIPSSVVQVQHLQPYAFVPHFATECLVESSSIQ